MLIPHSVEGIVEWDVLLTFRLRRLRSRPRSHVTSLAATRRAPLPSYPPGGSNTPPPSIMSHRLAYARPGSSSSPACARYRLLQAPSFLNRSYQMSATALMLGFSRCCFLAGSVLACEGGRRLGWLQSLWGACRINRCCVGVCTAAAGAAFRKSTQAEFLLQLGAGLARMSHAVYSFHLHSVAALLSCSCSFVVF
jgi:hypothetical protein